MLKPHQFEVLKELYEVFGNKKQKIYLRYQDKKIVIYNVPLAGTNVLRIDVSPYEEGEK